LFSDQKQKKIVDEVMGKVEEKYGGKLCTEVKELEQFYEAEEYHQSYYLNNKDSSYCKFVIQPKLDKLLDS
jgi:peptide-methionine (S)-S-oxide reductase